MTPTEQIRLLATTTAFPTPPPRKWPAVMIDIETMGTGDAAGIIEIGAVGFDYRGSEIMEGGFSRLVSLRSNEAAGRVIEADTLLWWMRRWNAGHPMPEEAHSVELYAALDELCAWLCDHFVSDGEVWTKGNFDARILEHALAGACLPCPWEHYQVRELRTVMKWEGAAKRAADVAHTALADAQDQARCVIGMWEDRAMAAAVFERPAETVWEDFKRRWEETHDDAKIPGWAELDEEERDTFVQALVG